MLKSIPHIGLTVTNLERSLNFYQNILGLEYQGQMLMTGKETDILFQQQNCTAKVAYLKTPDSDTLIELIEFTTSKPEILSPRLLRTSISEICFYTDDIQAEYTRLKNIGVEFLSAPQEFDFTSSGLGKSSAVYFKDPDGIILELIQNII